jgi:hypothetical protein
VKNKYKKIPPTAQFLNWNVDENLYLKEMKSNYPSFCEYLRRVDFQGAGGDENHSFHFDWPKLHDFNNKKIPPTAQFLNWNVDENLYLKFNWPYVQICLRL